MVHVWKYAEATHIYTVFFFHLFSVGLIYHTHLIILSQANTNMTIDITQAASLLIWRIGAAWSPLGQGSPDPWPLAHTGHISEKELMSF